MRILRKPYSKREYKDLKEYAEEQKPICRLLPLRDRSISSALEGMSKSVLDDSPGKFNFQCAFSSINLRLLAKT